MKPYSGNVFVKTMFFVSFFGLMLFALPAEAAGVFGNGTDGDVTISSNTHLTSNMEYNNLTVNAGITLYTNGYVVRVANNLINQGIITDTASGGVGGSGGSGGQGGRFASGHTPPQTGSAGQSGFAPSLSGAGFGGRGGGGGGGGGAAWETATFRWAGGGNGGNGGDGGDGGGFIEIYALNFENNGLIHANGTAGQNGLFPTQGDYDSWTQVFFNYDHAGGGGGGGAGGNGGNGGTVEIYYDNLISSGTVQANGGSPGIGRPGASGRNTSQSSAPNSFDESGASGLGAPPSGGNGGAGERGSFQSQSGQTGQNGSTGSPGSTSFEQTVTCYVDNDGDGYGDAADPGTPEVAPCGSGFVENNFDCDDGDNSINPDGSEIVADGIDQNCDGQEECYLDADNDGFGSPTIVISADLDCNDSNESIVSNDCNDGNSSVYPGATEIVADGIDQDCDGGEVCYQDNDGDGYGSPATVASADLDCIDAGESDNNFDCDDGDFNTNPDQSEIVADGIDQDCDGGDVCYQDNDGDGYGTPATIASADLDCDDSGESAFDNDCDDGDSNTYPGATEIVGDGIDQDCNGSEACYLDNDLDTYGSIIVFASVDLDCLDPGESINNTDCDDSDSDIYPGAPEIPGNGIDEDCDGADASCCFDVRGNIDAIPSPDIAGTGGTDIADLVYFVSFAFGGGPAPPCTEEADVDNSTTLDIADIVYLVSFMFSGGPAPLNCI